MHVFSLLVVTLLLTRCFFRFQHQDFGYEQIGDVSELLYICLNVCVCVCPVCWILQFMFVLCIHLLHVAYGGILDP